MKLKVVSVVAIVVMFFALSAVEVNAQGPPDAMAFWIKVYGAPPAVGNMSFGNRVANTTSGIDNALSFPVEFREQEPPPPGPGFDAIWAPVRPSQFGTGIRGLLEKQFNSWPGLIYDAQKDTFRINFVQADNSSQDISLKWSPAIDIIPQCDSLVMVYLDPNVGTNVRLNMITTDTLVIPAAGDNGVGFVRIFKYGGIPTITGVREDRSDAKPTTFQLSQNYPNPFNPTTRFEVSLPQAAHLEVAVYNLLGQKVATLANGPRSAGNITFTWDGRNDFGTPLPSGVYFARMNARVGGTGESFTALRKLLLMK